MILLLLMILRLTGRVLRTGAVDMIMVLRGLLRLMAVVFDGCVSGAVAVDCMFTHVWGAWVTAVDVFDSEPSGVGSICVET